MKRKKSEKEDIQPQLNRKPSGAVSRMLYKPMGFRPPSSLEQFAIAGLLSAVLMRRLRGWLRVVSLGGVWAVVELLRLFWFRRLIAYIGSSALRAPVAREGVKPVERASSDSESNNTSFCSEDRGETTQAQTSLCQHLFAALKRKHRFDRHARVHLLRNGLPDNTRGWFSLLYTVLSNSGTLAVSSSARAELQKVSAFCSNSEVGEPLEPVTPIWGLAAQNCAWPRPLIVDATMEVQRKLLELELLYLRKYKQRRMYVKIVNAAVEYLLWIHPGPKDSTEPPLVFMHGVGAGAVIYGPLLSHFAKSRSVIAVEVPGVSKAQDEEVGPSAILDGLASVIKIALGSQKVYDCVCHSGGGWWTIVLLRAAMRGQLEPPRRVVFMQTPCVVPAFLGIYLQGQGHYKDHFPCPYSDQGGFQGAVWRALGLLIFAFFGKDIWNIHLMYTCFAADELVLLPQTLKVLSQMSVFFTFGEQDGFIDAKACVAYIRDMLPAVRTQVVPNSGHGTFMISKSQWSATMPAVDRFLQTGEPEVEP